MADLGFKVFEVQRVGARGNQVRAVQSALPNWALSDFLKVDGIFGDATERAVKTFQSEMGLTSDGYVGPDTGRALGVWVDVLRGFDASHWNTILWDAVPGAVDFGIFKATQGASWVDPKFSENVSMALYCELTVGAYHFTEFENNPYLEAAHFLNAVSGLRLSQIYLDLEFRKTSLTSSAIFNWVDQFLKTVSGVISDCEVGIYTSKNYLREMGLQSFTGLSAYSLWAADWNDQPCVYPWKSWTTWQYTAKGDVDWAQGAVDLNFRVPNT